MKYPKLRELKEALASFFSRPYTTSFPAKPHIPFEKFRGKPTPDDNECIACGACAEVCPARAIEVRESVNSGKATREITWHYDLCIFCGQCERLCTTTKGVTLTKEYDLATLDRSTLFSTVSKELVVCECCGTVVAPYPQLLWLINKLGPYSSGNYNLTYTMQKELKIAEDIRASVNSADLQRPDLFKILCPKCRHIVLAFNQTGKQP